MRVVNGNRDRYVSPNKIDVAGSTGGGQVGTMKRQLFITAVVCAGSTVTLGAQQSRGPMGPGPMPGQGAMGASRGGAVDDAAQFLLAQTGELNLTDAQVTRLAAIARRSAERRRALRLQMDSLRTQRGPSATRPDSAERARMRQSFEQMRPAMQRLRDQTEADRRDAIAVLTPDQQARAWERVAASGRMRGGMGGRGFRHGHGVHGSRMGRRNEADRPRTRLQRQPDEQE
jgi:parvulin-like peptidyl-prolyl isomerase